MKIFDNAATGSLIEKRRVKYSTLQKLDFYMPIELDKKYKQANTWMLLADIFLFIKVGLKSYKT